ARRGQPALPASGWWIRQPQHAPPPGACLAGFISLEPLPGLPRSGNSSSGKLPRDHPPLTRPGGVAAATCPRATSDSPISRRIFGTNIRIRGVIPPSTSTFLTTRTRPLATGSSTWSKTTLPNSSGHSLTHRRPASTAVMVKEPPRLPRCLAQPDTPASNGPSSRAISLLASHSGQRATSVQTAHTAAGPASSVASHSNRCMTRPPGNSADIQASRPTHLKTGLRKFKQPPGQVRQKDGWPQEGLPAAAATVRQDTLDA